ncbi:MAG: PHP domain-containing protein [bacterium]
MPADLHVHTDYSDGMKSPETVVKESKAAGLTTIAITDHDSVGGIERAKKQGEIEGIEVIEGIELSTETAETEIHILGYFIDLKNSKLLEVIKKIQKDRVERVIKICQKLQAVGVDLPAEKVFAIAGKEAVGRPHVARALLSEGLIATFNEAFQKYIAFGGPAYVSHYKMAPKEAIDLINQAGGLAVYAHPGVSKADDLIPELALQGLAGIEVYYYLYREAQVKHYKELALKHGLLMTGGSDYHGIENGRAVKLGEFSIADELVEKLKSEHIHRNRS